MQVIKGIFKKDMETIDIYMKIEHKEIIAFFNAIRIIF
jgi:hypothetical protein